MRKTTTNPDAPEPPAGMRYLCYGEETKNGDIGHSKGATGDTTNFFAMPGHVVMHSDKHWYRRKAGRNTKQMSFGRGVMKGNR